MQSIKWFDDWVAVNVSRQWDGKRKLEYNEYVKLRENDNGNKSDKPKSTKHTETNIFDQLDSIKHKK